jgi:transposase
VKASIVAESYLGQESVSALARRHGLAVSQLFVWRRQFREELASKGLALPGGSPDTPAFVPAVIEVSEVAAPASRCRARRQPCTTGAAVELEIDGVAVKIAADADKRLILAVIEALKATR